LKVWASILAAILVAGLLASAAFAPVPPPQVVGYEGGVMLDPGHGGSDRGVVYQANNISLSEKEQVLKVAYILKGLLQQDGYGVCMTRGGDPSNANGPKVKDPGDDAFADDATLSNNDRYTYANTTGARIRISIHMNGSTDPAMDYTTLFGKWRKDKELAYAVFESLSTLPAAEGAGTIATNSPYSFASGVLLKSNMPATIAERVFITNNKEAALLSGPAGARQQQIAEMLRAGTKDYLSSH
jgi:N-acetylmuramoyl-L-alanine amidase